MADAGAPRRFDFGQPAVVGAPFVHAGHEYAPGDVFPYERLGLGRWEMRGYWLAGLVSFAAVTETTISMPGITSAELADNVSRRERKQRAGK